VLGGNASDLIGGSAGVAIDNYAGGHLTVAASTITNNRAVVAAGPYFGIGGAIDSNGGIMLSKSRGAIFSSHARAPPAGPGQPRTPS
jgi:hypothetical protein